MSPPRLAHGESCGKGSLAAVFDVGLGAEGEAVQEKVEPKRWISVLRDTARLLGTSQFPGKGMWEGAEPSCPTAGVPRAGFGDREVISGSVTWPQPLASPTAALPGFPLHPNGKGEGQGVVQALGIMREPPLH